MNAAQRMLWFRTCCVAAFLEVLLIGFASEYASLTGAMAFALILFWGAL